MNVLFRLFGHELFRLCIWRDQPAPQPEERGSCTTYPVGFTARHEVPELGD